MNHIQFTSALLAALLWALLCLAAPAPAERIDYGGLWRDLTSAEKELLLIGYARGLKSAEARMTRAIANESLDAEARASLLARARALSEGFIRSEEVKAAVEALDRFYANPRNHYLDWTDLVGVARAKLDGASEEKIEARLEFLRRSAEQLEEVIERQRAK